MNNSDRAQRFLDPPPRRYEMKEKLFEKGIIKVVWVEKDPKRVYSKMFEGVKDAEKFAKEKPDYIVFKLIRQKNLEEFEWEIMPLGKYKLYETLLKNYNKHRTKILALSGSKIGLLISKFIWFLCCLEIQRKRKDVVTGVTDSLGFSY